jgi:multiple sugar transport system substrate-binding protein
MTRRWLTAAAVLLPALSALAGGVQAKTIQLWHVLNIETDIIHTAIREWNARHPGTPVDARIVPLPQIAAELTKALATGTPPDIATFSYEAIASLADQGALEDLTELVTASPTIRFADVYPGPRESVTWKGRIYAVPRAVNTIALYYNADLFKAAGLDPAAPPATWEALADAAARLTDRQRGVFGLAFSAIQSEEGTFQWLPWLYQAGGSLADLTSPEARSALQYWVDRVGAGQSSRDVLTMRQYEATNTFINGNAAMVISGPWELPRIAADAKFDWRTAQLPVKEGKNIRASSLGDWTFTIPKGAANKDEAFKVVEFMVSDEIVTRAWTTGRLPPRPGVAVDTSVFPAAWATFSEQMAFARPRGPHPQWPAISRAVQIAIQEALTGRGTTEQALAKAAETIRPILAKTPMP